jgi:hypothetical protein
MTTFRSQSGSLMVGPVSIGCFFFLIPVVALLVAIFVLRWPWWGDVLAPVAVLVVLGVTLNRFERWQMLAWMRGHPEIRTQ